MRRIYFRAYHHKQKQLLSVKTVDFENKQVEVYSGFTQESITWKFDDIDISQNTTWHDKNGKEIFEGDLLAPLGGYPNDSCDYPLEIVWGKFNSCGCCYTVDGIGFDFMQCQEEISKYLVIIGNRYQNPELLKK